MNLREKNGERTGVGEYKEGVAENSGEGHTIGHRDGVKWGTYRKREGLAPRRG